MEPSPVEIRVLGSLIEKQRTTPDGYPLTLNSLRLACNQSTNRDPVVDYEEAEVRAALARLGERRWTRLASGHGSRAPKFRQLLDEALGLSGAQMALLAVLMLRGPQTPGELKQRTERLHPFADLAAVEATLEGLIGRELVARQERRPGQKEQRYVQLLGGEDGGEPAAAAMPEAEPAGAASPTPAHAGEGAAPEAAAPASDLEARVTRLEREVAELRERLGR